MNVLASMIVRSTLIALTAATLTTTSASALPSDPPVSPISPADGATVPTSPAGIEAVYACPRYTSYVDLLTGTPVTKGSSDYTVGISTSSAVSGNGVLSDTFSRSSVFTINDVETCRIGFASTTPGADPRPHMAPGTYHWQVWRSCLDCPGGVEVGPVRSFTTVPSTTLLPRPTGPIHAGIKTLIPVLVTADPGGIVTLQRRTATGSWVVVGASLPGRPGKVAAGSVAVIATLPAGAQTIRARMVVAGTAVSSPPRTVVVRRATRWIPGASASGSYRDPAHPSLRAAVTAGGRALTGFRVQVTATCSDLSVTSRIVTLPAAKIAPNGFFVAAAQPGDRYWLQGRLRGSTITGYASYQGSCSGDVNFTARRV